MVPFFCLLTSAGIEPETDKYKPVRYTVRT